MDGAAKAHSAGRCQSTPPAKLAAAALMPSSPAGSWVAGRPAASRRDTWICTPLAGTPDELMAQAEKAGAKVLKPAQKAQWGGYFGHFSDPDGYIWKVAGY